jgi:Homeodomain-like domain
VAHDFLARCPRTGPLSGPSPLYQPRFPAEFLDRARRLLRQRTAAAHLRQRARLVLLVHEQPLLSNVEVGTQVGLHPNSVRLWRQRWAEGLFALEDQPGRGRKPTFSPLGSGAG